MKQLRLFIILSVLVLAASVSYASVYEIDKAHSTIGFSVKHLQVSTTRGSFANYSGAIIFDENNLESFDADITINVASIDTNVEKRDKHLLSSDFFDVATYPDIKFKSTRLEKRGEGTIIVGELTIKDVTKTVTIPAHVSGPVTSHSGDKVIGITAEISINRQDYNVIWSKSMDNGGLVVDDMVTLVIEIEAHRKS